MSPQPSPPQSALQSSAPGLYHAVRRSFSGAVSAQFEALYGATCELIGKEDSTVYRPEGASYNPRPARICRILLEEFAAPPEVLGSALGVLLPEDAAIDLGEFPIVRADIVSGAKARLNGGRGDIPAPGEAIALAVVLDAVRHLHMSQPESARAEAVLNTARMVLGGMTSGSEVSRLVTLVEHALARYESRRKHGA
jgi:hypothetical protein